jgi:hypothetical protein
LASVLDFFVVICVFRVRVMFCWLFWLIAFSAYASFFDVCMLDTIVS